MSGRIVMVLSGFPRRSETFALNEIWALEQRGALAAIFATKAGEPFAAQPGSKALLGRVQELKERNTQRSETDRHRWCSLYRPPAWRCWRSSIAAAHRNRRQSGWSTRD